MSPVYYGFIFTWSYSEIIFCVYCYLPRILLSVHILVLLFVLVVVFFAITLFSIFEEITYSAFYMSTQGILPILILTYEDVGFFDEKQDCLLHTCG